MLASLTVPFSPFYQPHNQQQEVLVVFFYANAVQHARSSADWDTSVLFPCTLCHGNMYDFENRWLLCELIGLERMGRDTTESEQCSPFVKVVSY